MTAFLSRLLRSLPLLWFLFAASALPSVTCGYDAQTRHVSTAYDLRSLSATAYDSASALVGNERKTRATADYGLFIQIAESVAAESGAANRATFEAYKDSLRAQMSRPAASNPELNSLLDKLYRPNAQIGSGSTAAAVRQELATGQPVGGAFHSQKAQESITALQRWLNDNPTAAGADRAATENVIRDMQNALNGR